MTETRAEQYDRMRVILNGAHCKIEGCPNAADATRGPYAYLCPKHRAEAAGKRKPAETEFSLVQLAREVERTSAELERATFAHRKAVDELKKAIP